MSNAFWKIEGSSWGWLRHNLPWLAMLGLLLGFEQSETNRSDRF